MPQAPSIQEDIDIGSLNLDLLEFYCKMEVQGLHYKEKPADIETFVKGENYLNLSISIRPKVLEDLKALFSAPSRFAYCNYQEAVFDEGIGTGKSFKTSIIISYILHHLLCMENPQRDFGLEDKSLVAIMNMCHSGDNFIRLPNGEIKTIKELYDNQLKVKVASYDGKNFLLTKALKMRKTGRKQIFQVITCAGEEIKITDNHPLLTKAGWKQLKDIKIGERILRGNIWLCNVKKCEFSKDELKILAYLIGDGSLRETRIGFTAKNPQVIKDYKQSAINIGIKEFWERWHSKDVVSIFGKTGLRGQGQKEGRRDPIERIIRKAGLYRLYSRERFIPLPIMTAPQNDVKIFLSRLWSTDGSLKINKRKIDLRYTTSSYRLAIDVKDLLSRFGITSSIFKRKANYKGKSGKTNWQVCINDKYSQKIFCDKIGRYGDNLVIVKDRNKSGKTIWTKVKRVISLSEEDVFDMEVPIYHNLIVNGLLVHNSVNAIQAKKVVFGEIKQRIDNAPWFFKHRYSVNIRSELRFKGNITVIPGHSGARFPLGYNLIAAVMDEAAYYTETGKSVV